MIPEIKSESLNTLEFDQSFYQKKIHELIDSSEIDEFYKLRLAAVVCRTSNKEVDEVQLTQLYVCRYVTIVCLNKFT